MQIVSSGVTVYCTDIADTHAIMAYSFDESIDEITVCSEVKNTELQRGWIGDLTYVTNNTKNVENDNVKDIRDSWKDVLLASVRLSSAYGEPNMWIYTFLKK